MADLTLRVSRIVLGALLAYESFKLLRSRRVATVVTSLVFVVPFRLVLPGIWGVVLKRWYKMVKEEGATGVLELLKLLARRLGRVYISGEAVFFIFYLYEKWSLEQPVRVPPWNVAATGYSRMQYLIKVLDSFEEVNLATSARVPMFNRSSNDLASMNTDLKREKSIGANLVLKQAMDRGQVTSESLMRDFEKQKLPWSTDEDVAMLVLKRSCFTSWFNTADITEYKRGNMDSFIAECFFEGRRVAELSLVEREELKSLTDYAVDWIGMSEMEEGFNEGVRHYSLINDPLPSQYRPAFVYIVTHGIIPHLMFGLMSGLNFVSFRSGSLTYWLRRTLRKSGKLPVVFSHGIGIGLLPYYLFIRQLTLQFPDRDIFCVDLPFIAMRPNLLPSCREMAVCIEDMLSTWNFQQAHFMGHSYGTSVQSWVVHQAKHLIASFCLFDPICFLLLKSDLAVNCLYAPVDNPHSVFFSYWVTGELYMAHTLTRNFRWYDISLWPDSLTFPTLVTLSSGDALVPSLSVKYHLEAEKKRRVKCNIKMDLEIVWLEGNYHGQFLGDSESQRRVFAAVKNIIDPI